MTKSCCSSCCSSSGAACSCTKRRSNNGWLLFALGLSAGALIGYLSSRKHDTRPTFDELKVWEAELIKSRGKVAGTLLASRVQSRYEELYAARPHYANAALRNHLEANILPGLALYQVLREDGCDQQSALDEVGRLEEITFRESGMNQAIQQLSRLPNPFGIFRAMQGLVGKMFPKEGWTFLWKENNDRAIAYDCVDCFYLRTLTQHGAPELTPIFCHLDDVMFDNVSFMDWKRNKTLGRGDEVCNFRFEKKGN